jgi:hypothetical protein
VGRWDPVVDEQQLLDARGDVAQELERRRLFVAGDERR